MNFDDAIAAHIIWKARLGLYMEGLERLEAQAVAVDNACDLGKWLHGAGRAHQHHPSYELLRRRHAEFHQAAADVVRRCAGGQGVQQEAALIGPGSPFFALSTETLKHLIDLRDALAPARA